MVNPFAQRDVLLVGAGAALTYLAARAAGWKRPAGGIVLVAVAFGGLIATGNAAWSLGLALASLLASGWLAAAGAAWPGAWTLLLGAVLLAFGPGGAPGPLWLRLTVVALTPLVAAALDSFDRRRGSVALPLLAIAAAGAYGTEPDTEQTLVVLGALAGVCAAGWWLRAGIGRVATPAVAGLIVWTFAVDGRGRHSSIVAAIGCLGVLLAEPVAAALIAARRKRWREFNRWYWLVILALFQAGIVLISHAAGIRTSLGWALEAVAATLAATVAVLYAAGVAGLLALPVLRDRAPGGALDLTGEAGTTRCP